ncbi:Protein of unknown function [Daejeonella rubra]|uniref:DUF2490 domain-containing protein n=2 Tax=Daejeonella rubra TaxID=990371 RepID=A0A1G9V5L6_9SPHI|nr:Protein of unknown function [Daejeonella rubra]
MLFAFSSFGQTLKKNFIKQSLSTAAYSANFEFSPKWSLSAEIQERIFLEPVRQSQIFLKSQVNFSLLKDLSLGNGFAYYLNSPGDQEFASSFKVPEIRLNHELAYRHQLKHLNIGHRYRMEERFIRKRLDDSLIHGYRFIERLSYMVSLECNLIRSKNKVHDLNLKVSDGIYINSNGGIIYNTFDQNRFYAGLNYQLIRNLSVELGYINLFQQRSSGEEYLNRNIASLAINHRIKMHARN